MNFEYSEKAEELRREIREFVKKNVPQEGPVKFVEEHFDELWDHGMKCAKKLAEEGWLTMKWPEEYGGMGADPWEQVVMTEEAAYWQIPGLDMGVSGTKWVGPSIILFGTEEQKKKYLPKIANGEADGIWCTGYSEPDSGSDLASLQTVAIREGDEYVINGQKVWNSGGHRARYCWLACRTDPNAARKYDGISIIIVDLKSEGVTVRPIYNIIGAHYFNEIFFKDVRVPVENLVGVENNGWSQLMRALAFERGVALFNANQCKRVLDELVEFSKETGLFAKRDIRQKLVDIAVDIHALKLMALESEWKNTVQDNAPVAETSRDKAYSDEVCYRLSQVGSEILGSYIEIDPLASKKNWTKAKGYVENLFWTSPGMALGGGTIDTMKNIVAKFGLGLPKSY